MTCSTKVLFSFLESFSTTSWSTRLTNIFTLKVSLFS